jgi:hypothetical protein
MGEIERISFEDTADHAMENIMGNMDDGILKELDEKNKQYENIDKNIKGKREKIGKEGKENIGEENVGEEFKDDESKVHIRLINEDDIIGKLKNARGKKIHKQKTWEVFAEEQTKAFEELDAMGKINATLTINSIPNEKEFHKLLTVLKDEYGPGTIEFIVTENGWNKFYVMYKSSGLFGVVKALDGVNSSFNFEKVGEHRISIIESIKGERAEKRCVLHVSGKQKREIQRLLQDIKISESDFGLMCCISTFNRAKEKFERFVTDKFEAYYEDDGYVKLIRTEIDHATRSGIELLLEYLEIMFWDIESKTNEYFSNPYGDPKLVKYIKYKRRAMNGAIEAIESGNVEIAVKKQLFITAFREDLETIPIS